MHAIRVSRTGDPSVTQSCTIQQTNTTGDNRSDVQQSVNVGDAAATDVSQFANVSQENGSGSNVSQLQQNIQQSSKDPDSTGVQSQEGHQTADVTQDSATGGNRSDLNQSLAQNATTHDGTDTLTQKQNAQSFGPNSDAQVEQSSTLGRNDSHLNQSNDLAMRSNKVGAVTQTQGSFNGGLNGHVDQSSPGLSLSSASQSEKQKMDADKTTSLSQTQFGPSFCCSVQQSNPQDQFTISQSSQQFADVGANQLNTVVGNCDSSGNCSIDQRIQQGNTTTNNSCSGPSCHTGLLCSEGSCSPCGVDDSSCPSPPFECTECCEISCDFLPGLRQGSNTVLQRGLAVRLRR